MSTYAFVIGISEYKHLYTIINARLDAKRLYDQLNEILGEDKVRCLTDELATYNNIKEELDSLAHTTHSGDTIIIFYVGHGIRVSQGSETKCYLSTYETGPCNLIKSLNHSSGEAPLSDAGITFQEMKTMLNTIATMGDNPPGYKNLLIMLDCSYMTNSQWMYILPGKVSSDFTNTDYLQLRTTRGNFLLLGSSSHEYLEANGRTAGSFALGDKNQGMFAALLTESLHGYAPTDSARISLSALDIANYIEDQLKSRYPHQNLNTIRASQGGFIPVITFAERPSIKPETYHMQPSAPSVKLRGFNTSFRELLEDRVNLDDLRRLCFDLADETNNAVTFENLDGNNLAAKLLSLIQKCKDRSLQKDLVNAVFRIWPRIFCEESGMRDVWIRRAQNQ